MKKAKIRIFFYFILILICCKEPNSQNTKINNLEQFHWLLGTWEAEIDDGLFIENWSIRNKKLIGNSLLREENIVTFREKIELKYIKDTLNYVVSFNGNTTNFKATSISDSLLIFENPKNDFPKIIKYQRISIYNIKATILDENKSEVFDFYKN